LIAPERLDAAIGRLRDPEVDDLDATLEADDEVRRRAVAMDDAERPAVDADPIVRVVQPGGAARRDRQHARDRDLRAGLGGADLDRAHGLAVHVLHRGKSPSFPTS
jgi:hypothetical protein